MRTEAGWLFALTCSALAGCGGDDGNEDAGTTDAPVTDAGNADGGPADAGPPDAGLPQCLAGDPGDVPWAGEIGPVVELTGTVYGEGAGDRMDAGMAGADGGVPDGSVATPGGRIVGAQVRVRELLTGQVMRSTTTDALGAYTIEAPMGALVWLEVEAVPGYLGVVRPEAVRAEDSMAYDLVLPSRSGVEGTAAGVGVSYDDTRGTVGTGFNPVTPDQGGEGAELGCTDHAPGANLIAGGAIASPVLVPRCGAAGELDAGVACTDEERSNQLHFLGVAPGWTQVHILSPPGGTCALRFPVGLWLVRPDTFTNVNVDCH